MTFAVTYAARFGGKKHPVILRETSALRVKKLALRVAGVCVPDNVAEEVITDEPWFSHNVMRVKAI